MKDKALQKLVETELDWDPRLDAAGIGVTAHDGVVSLGGTVGSYSQKLQAQAIAIQVRGVHGLANDLEVRPFGDIGNSDDEIASRALSSLRWDIVVPDEVLKVIVEDGYVTLTGTVEWDYQRQAAARAVEKLSGVRQITNDIALRQRVSPDDIEKQINAALERQGRLKASDIKVSVDGGKVSLKGQVKSWSDRALIEHAAWATKGVYAVADHVTVAA